MIFLLSIPIIAYLTFAQLIASGFPELPGEYRGFLGWTLLVFVGCGITAIISLIPLGAALLVGSLPKRVSKMDRDYPLVTLRQKDGSRGSFFLGSGSINDVQYYFWYRKDGDHVSGGKTERTSSVRIYERDGPPLMRTWKCVYRNPLATKLLWMVGIDWRDDDIYSPDFFIPAGSIKDGYSL